jgi:hypothetical protein
MSNYNQKQIPETYTHYFASMNKEAMRKYVRSYYNQHFQGKRVINEDLKIPIEFIGKGKKKTAYGAAMYSKKAAAVLVLHQIVKYAKYTNWGERKITDPKEVIGYYNFKVKVKIDGAICFFALNIQVCIKGKYQYSIDECRFSIE